MNTEFKSYPTLRTDGSGMWSSKARPVDVVDMAVPYVNEEETFGELRVYFSKDNWSVEDDGLIYTDDQFLAQLRLWLNDNDYAGADVSYSEAGMQGSDFVSFDVGSAFLQTWFHR